VDQRGVHRGCRIGQRGRDERGNHRLRRFRGTPLASALPPSGPTSRPATTTGTTIEAATRRLRVTLLTAPPHTPPAAWTVTSMRTAVPG
jgi:hypothetical protein